MQIDEVRRVTVLGAGTMGQQIAFQCAAHGYQVVVYDTAPASVAAAPERIRGYGQSLLAAGAISLEQIDQTIARITPTGDRQLAAAEADLISEAIPEDPKLKGRVLGEFNALCPPRTVFATNTSTLVPSQFAKATGRAARLVALHFHLPVWTNNLADVMPHAGTDPQVTALVQAFAQRIGQVAIVLGREHHGYVFNAMYTALNREAITLAQQGVASIEDIDRAWMHVTKAPVGPLGALDAVGLDTAWQITQYWARKLFWIPQLRRNARFLKRYVDEGALGVKSGRGFYTYPDPAYAQPGFLPAPAEPGPGSPA